MARHQDMNRGRPGPRPGPRPFRSTGPPGSNPPRLSLPPRRDEHSHGHEHGHQSEPEFHAQVLPRKNLSGPPGARSEASSESPNWRRGEMPRKGASPAGEQNASQSSKLNPSARVFEMATGSTLQQPEQQPQVLSPSVANPSMEQYVGALSQPISQPVLPGPGSYLTTMVPPPPSVMPYYPMFYYNADQPQQVVMLEPNTYASNGMIASMSYPPVQNASLVQPVQTANGAVHYYRYEPSIWQPNQAMPQFIATQPAGPMMEPMLLQQAQPISASTPAHEGHAAFALSPPTGWSEHGAAAGGGSPSGRGSYRGGHRFTPRRSVMSRLG